MISQKECDRLWSEAYALPVAEYKNPRHLKLRHGEGAMVDMYNVGRTSTSSKVRYIGTDVLYACLGNGVHNPRRKMSLVAHIDMGETDTFAKARRCMRGMILHSRDTNSDPLEVHLVGANNLDIEPVDRNGFNPATDIMRYMEEKRFRNVMAGYLHEIEQHPNVTLKTFDIDDKPHPLGFAINSRTGDLIAATPSKAAPWGGVMRHYENLLALAESERHCTPANLQMLKEMHVPVYYDSPMRDWQLYGDYYPSKPEDYIVKGQFCFDGTQMEHRAGRLK